MPSPPDDNYDASEHCKSVYAHFGLAYYESGVIESGIVNALLWGEFLIGWKERIAHEGRGNFDRKVYEAEFDVYMEKQFVLSMGNLLKRLNAVIGIPDELKDLFVRGKKQRDFLAHHYFCERATDFVTRDGRDRMISELAELAKNFSDMDRSIQSLLTSVKARIGPVDSQLNRFTEEFSRRAHAGEALDYPLVAPYRNNMPKAADCSLPQLAQCLDKVAGPFNFWYRFHH